VPENSGGLDTLKQRKKYSFYGTIAVSVNNLDAVINGKFCVQDCYQHFSEIFLGIKQLYVYTAIMLNKYVIPHPFGFFTNLTTLFEILNK
jgi:hypothetical protein